MRTLLRAYLLEHMVKSRNEIWSLKTHGETHYNAGGKKRYKLEALKCLTTTHIKLLHL